MNGVQRKKVMAQVGVVLLSAALIPVFAGCGGAGLANADFNIHDPVPTVTGVSPSSGPVAGGTAVTVTGSGFTNNGAQIQLSFGNFEASQVKIVSSTKLTAITPAGTGTVDVQVTTDGGSSSVTNATRFVYQ